MTNATNTVIARRSFLAKAIRTTLAAAVIAGTGASTITPVQAGSPSYKQGYSQGKKIGQKHGYEDGYIGAYKASYRDALTRQRSNGGFASTQSSFNWEDYVRGYKKGYKVGYKLGYKSGQADGDKDGEEDGMAWRDNMRDEMRNCMRNGTCGS